LDAPQKLLAKMCIHLSEVYRSPYRGLDILQCEPTYQNFKHLKVVNIQSHKFTNLKFNVFSKSMRLFLICWLSFDQRDFWHVHQLFMLLNHLFKVFVFFKTYYSTLGWLSPWVAFASNLNANSKGFILIIECLVELYQNSTKFKWLHQSLWLSAIVLRILI
jgi:hypothetical protein